MPVPITLVKSADGRFKSIGIKVAKAIGSITRFPDLESLSKHYVVRHANGYSDLDC